jgi:hypothetical protein
VKNLIAILHTPTENFDSFNPSKISSEECSGVRDSSIYLTLLEMKNVPLNKDT